MERAEHCMMTKRFLANNTKSILNLNSTYLGRGKAFADLKKNHAIIIETSNSDKILYLKVGISLTKKSRLYMNTTRVIFLGLLGLSCAFTQILIGAWPLQKLRPL